MVTSVLVGTIALLRAILMITKNDRWYKRLIKENIFKTNKVVSWRPVPFMSFAPLTPGLCLSMFVYDDMLQGHSSQLYDKES
jgi:hypothetical protein